MFCVCGLWVKLLKVRNEEMAHLVDVHVGKRIRQRRWLVGMTQQKLAEAVGIKFQQIQKYETGMNRVSASRLWDIAEALSVPVSFFFEGLADESLQSEADQELRRGIDRLDHRFHRHREIGSGVRIRHRKDIEAIEPPSMLDQGVV